MDYTPRSPDLSGLFSSANNTAATSNHSNTNHYHHPDDNTSTSPSISTSTSTFAPPSASKAPLETSYAPRSPVLPPAWDHRQVLQVSNANTIADTYPPYNDTLSHSANGYLPPIPSLPQLPRGASSFSYVESASEPSYPTHHHPTHGHDYKRQRLSYPGPEDHLPAADQLRPAQDTVYVPPRAQSLYGAPLPTFPQQQSLSYNIKSEDTFGSDQAYAPPSLGAPNTHPYTSPPTSPRMARTMNVPVKAEEDGKDLGPTMGIEIKTKFPVARIKRIMQADEEVGKVAQVTPVAVCKSLLAPLPRLPFFVPTPTSYQISCSFHLLAVCLSSTKIRSPETIANTHATAKALELFMISLCTRAAAEARTRSSKRVTASHIKAAIGTSDVFDFLKEIVEKVPDGPEPGAPEEKEGKGRSRAKKERSADSAESSEADVKGKRRRGGGRKRGGGAGGGGGGGVE